MAILVDWVKQAVSGTPGTGVITLGSAVSGYIRFQDDTRITNGSVVYYTIEDGANRERGIGTYASSGTTLTRTSIHAKIDGGTYSENPGTGLNLTSAAVVSCSAIADMHNFIGASVYHSTTQSIANATTTTLSFDSENYDTHGFHDTVTNNSRLTIPTSLPTVMVRLFGSVAMTANTTGDRVIQVFKNTSVVHYAAFKSTTASINNVQNFVTDKLSAVAGDYFEVKGYQNSGSALNANPASLAYTHWFGLQVLE